jgi:Tfp pilus assembly protein PilP
MRLAKSSRTLLPLVLSAVLATSALAQEHPNVQPNAVRAQLSKPVSAGSKPQGGQQASAPSSPAQAPAKTPGKAPAQTPPQAPAKAPAKASAKAPAKAPMAAPAKAPADSKVATKTPSGNSEKTSAQKSAEKPAEEKAVVRRDPFDTLLTKARAGNAPPENLPPGKAGLIIEMLRINGIVHSPSGMIAIVSNSQQRVYFLRDGDKLYDGSVQKISLNEISFQEIGKDAFGKPLERTVTKQLYPSSGEKQ